MNQTKTWYKLITPRNNQVKLSFSIQNEIVKELMTYSRGTWPVPVSYLSKTGDMVYLIPSEMMIKNANLLKNYSKVLVSDSLENLIALDSIDGSYEAMEFAT